MNHDEAIALVDAEIAGTPSSPSEDDRRWRSDMLGLRSVLRAGQRCQQVVARLAPLCLCNAGPDTDGPQQDCPIDGDGETFVALCRWRDAVVATASTYREFDTQDDEVRATEVWNRLCALLDAGPWAPPAAQVVGAAAELEIEGRGGTYVSADPDRWF